MSTGLRLTLTLEGHPRSVDCPSCGALAGVSCRSLGGAGNFTRPHGQRIELAREKGV